MLEPPDPSEEIAEWLLTIRLSQYTSCFLEGGYKTLEDCKDLTEEHLVDLKVVPTGHRRRILHSLEALGLKQQSGGEEDEEEGVENGRRQRNPTPYPRHIFLKDKKRGMSYQYHQPKELTDLEGSQTLPPGAGLGIQTKDHSERGHVRLPQPTPRNQENIQTSMSEPMSIPPSWSSYSSSSESVSTSEMPSDWEISSEDPMLSSTDSIPGPAEAPHPALTEDTGYCGEMVENSIYERQSGVTVSAGPRLTRSYRLRHRPVPKIPDMVVPPRRER